MAAGDSPDKKRWMDVEGMRSLQEGAGTVLCRTAAGGFLTALTHRVAATAKVATEVGDTVTGPKTRVSCTRIAQLRVSVANTGMSVAPNPEPQNLGAASPRLLSALCVQYMRFLLWYCM